MKDLKYLLILFWTLFCEQIIILCIAKHRADQFLLHFQWEGWFWEGTVRIIVENLYKESRENPLPFARKSDGLTGLK